MRLKTEDVLKKVNEIYSLKKAQNGALPEGAIIEMRSDSAKAIVEGLVFEINRMLDQTQQV